MSKLDHETVHEGEEHLERKSVATGEDEPRPNTTEADQEKAAPDSTKFEAAPDGGARAWLVAAGGFCITFCCLGFTSTFGIFQQYYTTHQLRKESPDKIAWIGSLAAFIQFAVGCLSGPLFDRFGTWVCFQEKSIKLVC